MIKLKGFIAMKNMKKAQKRAYSTPKTNRKPLKVKMVFGAVLKM